MTDLPAGFVANGIAAGVKANGELDMALVATSSSSPVSAGAVFTQNLAAAAPVVVSRRHLTATGGRIGAVVLNSGCANAATGAAGLEAAEQMTARTADCLGLEPQEVLVCSTGVIGFELPIDRITRAIPDLCAGRDARPEALARAARAIMTTDTREKLASANLGSGGRVVGLAKGAAMLAPNMATMLAVVLTDVAIDPGMLQEALAEAVSVTFNRLSIDGCTSTNDTVIALASGSRPGDVDRLELGDAIEAVCADLAQQMAADAEGGTKVVRVTVRGASDATSALVGARKVADANLVKCSWYGADPNWGRVVSELGTASIPFDADKVAVAYGPHVVCRDGVAVPHDSDALHSYLSGGEIELCCDLGLGEASGSILSADLTHGYIDENMGLS